MAQYSRLTSRSASLRSGDLYLNFFSMSQSSISKLRADGYLLLATLAWGTTFPLIKQAIQFISPSLFVSLRFALASLILSPFLIRALLRSQKKTFIFGCILGFINTCIYVTQATGMETIGPAEGAFLTGFNVILVPMLMPFFNIGKPKTKDFVCGLICLFGIFVLTGAGFSHLEVGVYWVLLGSIFIAFSILCLQKFTQSTPDLDALAFAQILTTVILISPWTLYTTTSENLHEAFQLMPLLSICFCAIFATSFALLIQTRYQRMTTPSRASLIFSLEPVFATLFGYFINGEAVSWRIAVGGIIILGSILTSEFWGRR
jgi:drug/metabolite transporter (DMT)-like permease